MILCIWIWRRSCYITVKQVSRVAEGWVWFLVATVTTPRCPWALPQFPVAGRLSEEQDWALVNRGGFQRSTGLPCYAWIATKAEVVCSRQTLAILRRGGSIERTTYQCFSWPCNPFRDGMLPHLQLLLCFGFSDIYWVSPDAGRGQVCDILKQMLCEDRPGGSWRFILPGDICAIART